MSGGSSATPEELFPYGAIVGGTVVQHARFGVFVRLEHDADGLIEVPHLFDDPLNEAPEPERWPSIGETIDAVVIDVRSMLNGGYQVRLSRQTDDFRRARTWMPGNDDG